MSGPADKGNQVVPQSGVAGEGNLAGAEPFINKAEAARRLGIAPRTLDQWLHDGRIPFYRIGHSCRLRWSEVQAHLAATCRVARRSAR